MHYKEPDPQQEKIKAQLVKVLLLLILLAGVPTALAYFVTGSTDSPETITVFVYWYLAVSAAGAVGLVLLVWRKRHR